MSNFWRASVGAIISWPNKFGSLLSRKSSILQFNNRFFRKLDLLGDRETTTTTLLIITHDRAIQPPRRHAVRQSDSAIQKIQEWIPDIHVQSNFRIFCFDNFFIIDPSNLWIINNPNSKIKFEVLRLYSQTVKPQILIKLAVVYIS